MTQTIEAYPLCWPPGWPRTPWAGQKRAAFKITQERAQNELMHEIRLLGGRNIIISTNMPIRRDGMPYSAKRIISDPGVSVYFEYKGKQKCFSCDKWEEIKDNIWAICKTINALRGIDRWGSGDMVEAAFSGFDALPPPSSSNRRAWYEILDVDHESSMEQITTRYKTLAKEHHPDLGGNPEKMAEINAAYDEAKKIRG